MHIYIFRSCKAAREKQRKASCQSRSILSHTFSSNFLNSLPLFCFARVLLPYRRDKLLWKNLFHVVAVSAYYIALNYALLVELLFHLTELSQTSIAPCSTFFQILEWTHFLELLCNRIDKRAAPFRWNPHFLGDTVDGVLITVAIGTEALEVD